MSKLFVFGDSFSEKWDDLSPYSVWSGYIPKVYSQMVSEKLGIECFNFAKGGWSNADIFQSVCQNADKIGDGDIVIIGWTIFERFRLSSAHPINPFWIRFQAGNWDLNLKANLIPEGISETTVNEILYNRSFEELYIEEVSDWIKLLSKTFKGNTFINFRWWGKPMYETITTATNGEIFDWHWSERGHMDFSEWLLDKIEVGGFVNELI